MKNKIDLKSLTRQQIDIFFKDRSIPSFRTGQLIHWIYEKKTPSIDHITEFSKSLRAFLNEEAYISNLHLLKNKKAPDGTEKFLFQLEDKESIESVLIRDGKRVTLCISSQVGCAMGCRFCLTGKMGLKRNLLAHEIVDQIISVSGNSDEAGKITNIVLMGMGEPLMNFDNVVDALERMTSFLHLSNRRITLSTSGIVPKIVELYKRIPKISLAVSLNATTDQIREHIMPINRAYNIRELINVCRSIPLPPRKRITFEYVLLKGINDSREDALRLVSLLKGIRYKINLIPFNEFPDSELNRPEESKIETFQRILLQHNITAIIRKSKGGEISAACGQLKGV